MLNIHDIKPLEEIPDYSIYIFYGMIVFFTGIILLLLYMLFTYIQKKRNSPEKNHLRLLQNIDFSDPKSSAYTISKYGALLAKDDRQLTLLMELNQQLESYKYKKEVPKQVDKKTQTLYETFMDSLDV